MTVKDALLEFAEEMTEDEAAYALEALAERFGSSTRIVPVLPEERESIRQGLAQLDAGERIPHEEALQRLRYGA